jgi:hypothetical protein
MCVGINIQGYGGERTVTNFHTQAICMHVGVCMYTYTYVYTHAPRDVMADPTRVQHELRCDLLECTHVLVCAFTFCLPDFGILAKHP